ncbi:MAG: LytTR family DNA-binding domain-containing protein [Bacteroidota bacterium]
MRVLIIEDEKPAARRLRKLIGDCRPEAIIVEVLDSVEASVAWLNSFESPDLIFMDIQLADGISFDIFAEAQIEAPVIFTTAYDQYTLKAFKFNSVDYLLKPIDPDELKPALDKFDKVFHQNHVYDKSSIEQLLESLSGKSYKERFLVKMGQQLSYVATTDIAYFFSEDGFVHIRDRNNKRHIIDYTLDQLEGVLSPDHFFRINRKIITHLDAIHKIHTYFNSRLKLELRPTADLEVIVSRDRVGDFKLWLDK